MEVTREVAKKLLSSVPENYAFRCCDGRLIRNVRELGKTLAHMADESFYYHVNQNKNDFSKWVNDMIGDEKLARHLNRAGDKHQALRELSDRIAFLSGQLAQ
jgi:hypothetical protein